ncbi:MAG: phosphatidate cytidylyltransferase [endosymbiont of Galathealinum brachiosum]|uniref:Phosphatidate cytidylyltransferase n=1 Tax=endosymbiont of Galathealinum brachiosum TaxID=2200906 RepID=A0A370DK51_9GAMM|nr:MAG: phosphatidate cytidylyltransferase [endosymbiont of Galathealinum brachiosum]
MLKQRVLTAIPLAALVVWGIITQPVNIVFYSLLVVMLISGWEWARLSGVQHAALRAVYALLITAGAYFSQLLINDNPQWLTSILSITVLVWFVAIYHMFSKGPQPANQSISVAKLIIGIVALIPPVLALMLVRAEGAWWLFYCLSIVWVADIGAYFSGKRFGKNKLAPTLSPGKTKEGMYGAVFATAVYSFLAAILFELQIIELLMLLIIAALATFISVAGDLSVSLLKREKDLKDTGSILPGHGGILDRIDSVLSSAPFLALLLSQVIF